MKALRLFMSIFFLLLGTFLSAQNKATHTIQPSTTLSSENYQSVTFNGIWCWFSDPRAVYYEGKFKRTYLGWIDNYGDVHVGYYDHETQQIASKVIYDNLEIDDHDNPSILFDEEGKLLVFFNTHLQDERPLFLRTSLEPESIEKWSPVRELFLNDDETYRKARILRHTYTNPVRLSKENGAIYLFWRGVDLKPSFSVSTDNGKTWSPGKILFQPKETLYLKTPYTKVYSDGKSKIHFVITDGHPAKDAENALYYMYYENGAFYKANGTKIKEVHELPVRADEMDIIYTSESVKLWNWDIAEDAAGNPIVTYAKFPNDEQHIYCYATFQNNTWKIYELIDSGGWFPNTRKGTVEASPHYSGGIVIDHENPTNLYLSVKRDSFFEIEQWTTHDFGKTWKVKPITKNSTKDNIRPFAVRNAKQGNPLQVAWLQSTNYMYYALQAGEKDAPLDFKDRYHTAVKINLPKPVVNNDVTPENLIRFLRMVVEQLLENPNHSLAQTDWRFGMRFAGIQAFAKITDEQRYQNELSNIQQYKLEEIDADELSTIDIIWSFQTPEERSYLQRIEFLELKDFNKLDAEIAFTSLLRVMELYENNISTIAALKKDLKGVSTTFTEILSANYIGKTDKTRALAIYAVATGIRNGWFSENYKEKIIQKWKLFQEDLCKKNRISTLNTETLGAVLLAGNEVYQIIHKKDK